MNRVATIVSFGGFLLAIVLAVSLVDAPVHASGAPPSCLRADADTVGAYREVALPIERDDVTLAGRLFIPREAGPHPAVVLLHGGGQQRLNEAPLFFAPLLARCGVAALVYDKRGTTDSSGVWETASFDDFVDDAAAAVETLARRTDIDAGRIGLIGFSQGGRLAPVVAVRHGQVAFVVSVSGPFTSIIETRLYALDQRLRRWSLSGAALDSAMTLWKKHFAAVKNEDAETLAALDDVIEEAAHRYGTSVLPPPSDRVPQTPLYNSIGRDYTAEIHTLRIPMLAVFGERDAVVPVKRSVLALQRALQDTGHQELDIQIIPYADHSFVDWTFKERIKIEETVIDWVVGRLAAMPSGAPRGAPAKR